MTEQKKKIGKIIQVIGPVVDVEFSEGDRLPSINDALTLEHNGKTIIFEVAKHLEPGKVRAISLK